MQNSIVKLKCKYLDPSTNAIRIVVVVPALLVENHINDDMDKNMEAWRLRGV